MAKDIFHDDVRKALEADGWKITHDPFFLKAGGLNMEVDLAAERVLAAEKGEQKIVVEIKSFLSKSKLKDFYEAKGQYDMYRRGLEKNKISRTLFLAVEEDIFNTFFQKPLIWETVIEEKIFMIVFNHLQKKIIRWIP
jgi:hypothetical protein